MDLTEITQAIDKNPELVTGVFSHIRTIETGTKLIDDLVGAQYQTKIGAEVKKIYDQFDNDALAIIGEKPEEKDGKTVKTYDFIKQKLEELKTLRGQKESLTKDAEVARLTAEIETLKADDKGGHWKTIYETSKSEQEEIINGLREQITGFEKGNIESRILRDLDSGFSKLKLNPNIPETAIKAVFEAEKQRVLKSAKIDGEKIIYLDAENKPILSENQTIATGGDIVSKLLKDFIVSDSKKGGQADETIKGQIKTIKSEDGKSTKDSLVVVGDFKNKVELANHVRQTLADEGISKSDDRYFDLTDEAMRTYGKDLPIQ